MALDRLLLFRWRNHNYSNDSVFASNNVDTKKPDTGMISANLMFEFGFLLEKLNYDKIHVFFIDIDENDIKIPSDIRGIWADYLCSNEDHNDIVETIVNTFLKRQYSAIETAINRKISRNKNWDKDINHDYLNALRNMYDDWFFDISKTFDQNNILRLDTDAPINIDKIFEFINK